MGLILECTSATLTTMPPANFIQGSTTLRSLENQAGVLHVAASIKSIVTTSDMHNMSGASLSESAAVLVCTCRHAIDDCCVCRSLNEVCWRGLG